MADVVKLIHSAGAESRSKAVRPKALLDNCLKVMRMLYGVPCELSWGSGWGARPWETQVPHRGALSHAVAPVPSVQVGGSPPNTAEKPSLDTSLPWSLGCCLCSAPPRAPWGVPKEGAKVGQMPPLPGPNTTPSRTVGLFMAAGSCPSKTSGTFCMGLGSDTAPRGRQLLGGHAALPAHRAGEGITLFLSICIFSSAFIKHQLIL